MKIKNVFKFSKNEVLYKELFEIFLKQTNERQFKSYACGLPS